MKRYGSPLAFKAALEARLRTAARQSGRDQNRLRMRVVMDRFVARLGQALGDQVVLKGGLVLELRLGEARATKDVDLRLVGAPSETLHRLRTAGRLDLGDHLSYQVRPDPRHPTIHAEGMAYEGLRFRVQTTLAGKPYGGPFGVDAAFAEPLAGAPETVVGSEFLAFAGVPPGTFKIYPVATHLAEKLHAYTLPRTRPNTRVKDLPDMALLGLVGPLQASVLRDAIETTFGHRGTHPVPTRLPDPPAAWAGPYLRLSRRDGLRWPDLDAVAAAARSLLDPVLVRESGVWSHEAWAWSQDESCVQRPTAP